MKKITGPLFLAMLALFFPLDAFATFGAIINNGTIQMGINQEGHLNIDYVGDPEGIGSVGLRYMPTGGASTEPGCLCEGWGVGDSISGRSGYANESSDGGAVNIVVESFTSTGSTATCVVRIIDEDTEDDIFRVTHAYFPSPVTSNLYQVDVTVENISGASVNLLYRRVMDWDIFPTYFDEYVTISHFAVGNLIRTDTNGFNSANPLDTPDNPIDWESYVPGPVTDAGIDDHGALFDFDFGPLDNGAIKSFTTFYGAAGTEADAFAALVAAGAEIYSFGQPSSAGGPDLGTPNTFIFAFKGIGGTAVGGTTLTVEDNGLGNGVVCGMVVGRDGKGPMSAAEGAGMIALYFGLLLAPVAILRFFHGRKRGLFNKAGLIALLVAAIFLAATSAQAATHLLTPKAQRFHPTTDGLGALTVDSDETIGKGKLAVGLMLNFAKKPLNFGDIIELRVEKTAVDELYTANLTAAYGLTKYIELGLDLPYNYAARSLNIMTDEYTSDSYIGDIRANAKIRLIDAPRYGLALVAFANFPTANNDFLLSEDKFGFGAKAAVHYDVTKAATLYANLGAEHVGDIGARRTHPDYYTPWWQYGVGGVYRLPGTRKDQLVAEINGETPIAYPYGRTVTSPFEVLGAYRREISPGLSLTAGGGGGLNKGMGAPQWRAILGIACKM